MKKAWRPIKNNPSPNLHILLQGEARELYWNWRIKVRADQPDRVAWLKGCLMRCDKLYGAGAGEKVRNYMTLFKKEIEGV
jgi:hypothetical protein